MCQYTETPITVPYFIPFSSHTMPFHANTLSRRNLRLVFRGKDLGKDIWDEEKAAFQPQTGV